MPSENDGAMIVLSSPSGAGKTTLVKMLSKMDNYEISICLLYTSDAAADTPCVDLGGRRII